MPDPITGATGTSTLDPAIQGQLQVARAASVQNSYDLIAVQVASGQINSQEKQAELLAQTFRTNTQIMSQVS